MNLADELRKLDDLRRSGILSDAEFQQAKALLLAGGGPPAEQPTSQLLSDQLAEVRHQNELTRIDREWEIERQQYLISGRYGRRHVPTAGDGITTAVVGGGFGLLWLIMALAVTSEVPFPVVGIVFPLFGVVFIVAAVSSGVSCYSRAEKYDAAFQAYKRRRQAVLDQFHSE
ncbi:MAG: SHOCT domain-containing protein [Fimbriiglobus sp.]